MAKRRQRGDYLWIGGATCLDFSNTQSYRPTDKPFDRLETYGCLLDWAGFVKILAARQLGLLRKQAELQPRLARSTLKTAKSLREAIYRICSGHARGRTALTNDLHALTEAAIKAHRNRKLIATTNGFCWQWQDKTELGSVLWPIALSAVELVASERMCWVRECCLESCSALFIDSSKNKRRRWCDMKDCGNLAKARTHRAKNRH